MKRMISVVAVALLLIMALTGGSYARVAPYEPLELLPTDDHSWGGESDGANSLSKTSSGRYSGLVLTGFAGVDIFVNAGFVDWLFGDRLRRTEHTKYYIIRNAQQDEGERGVNVNHRGN